jgi:uncharacterized membrane protein
VNIVKDDDTASDPPDRESEPSPESYVLPLVTLTVVILPQVLIPERFRQGPILLVPVIEVAVILLLMAVAAKPGPVPRGARPLILSLFGVLVLANTIAAARLVIAVLRTSGSGHAPATVTQLLVGAGLVLAANVVTFALLYWQLDLGGPSGRQSGSAGYPDFQFPQTGTTGLAPSGWQPRFPDYLYLAYTNIVAFSPTDTVPLTHRVKGLMTVQSIISLTVLVVVISRVINILPT